MQHNNRYYDQVSLVIDALNIIDWEKSCFALKGGTAINLFYENYPRASVDIDLVYLPNISRDESLTQMKDELKRLTDIFKKRGFNASVKNISAGNPVGKIELTNNKTKIIIEPNTLLRSTIYPTENRELCQEVQNLFKKEATVKCVAYLELYAGKLNAMLDRQHPRDIFDMLIFFDRNKTLKLVMDAFMAYLVQGNRPFSEMIDPNLIDIKDIYEKAFAGMTEIETTLDKLLKARINVIKEMKKCLTDNHKNFLLSIMNSDPDWSLLPFPNLKDMPAIKWKLQNIAKMSGSKKKEEIASLESIFKR